MSMGPKMLARLGRLVVTVGSGCFGAWNFAEPFLTRSAMIIAHSGSTEGKVLRRSARRVPYMRYSKGIELNRIVSIRPPEIIRYV